LDTNTCIRLLNRRRDPATANVIGQLKQHKPQEIYLCSVVQYELWFGVFKSQQVEKNLLNYQQFIATFACLDFDAQTAYVCGQLRADLQQRGTPIGPYDLMIAATALVHQCHLVTANTREFSRITNLPLVNWEL
jgi:tRNA(fMet)-specific endonuclease VapC